MNKPLNAPGCFAAASVFSHDSEVCAKCCAFDACASASLETLEQIRNIVNVADLLKRHEKAKRAARQKIKEADEALAAAMPPGNIQQPLVGAVDRKTEVATVKFDVSPDHERVIATLQSKLQKITVSLCKKGYIDGAIESVKKGRVTLSESAPPWFRLALTSLLSGGFSRSQLKQQMASELGWQDSTTGPHASMAVILFKAFGIAQEIEERIVLTPATGA